MTITANHEVKESDLEAQVINPTLPTTDERYGVIYTNQGITYLDFNRTHNDLSKPSKNNSAQFAPILIGKSVEIRSTYFGLARNMNAGVDFIIYGDSGTGKELVAKTLHYGRPNLAGEFIALNCSSIPEGLFESELFGHDRGAFTGAIRKRVGALRSAKNGTLLLDEIGDLSLANQAKLLRALQERKAKALGTENEYSFNVRVIVAANKNLLELVKENKFRQDLYYRLAKGIVRLPNLRERIEDIPLLSNFFLEQAKLNLKKPDLIISEEGMKYLVTQPWPGNVRELENTIERAALMSKDGLLDSLIIDAAINIQYDASQKKELDSMNSIVMACVSEFYKSGRPSREFFYELKIRTMDLIIKEETAKGRKGALKRAAKILGVSSRDSLRGSIRYHKRID